MSLLAPAFLLGLLAIGLPLWLHRLSSENPNRQRFSSLMFLEPGEPRRVLAKNVQYLLLLALRIAVLVLLALAFAQPAWWRDPESSAGGDGAELHLIVLDRSASMGYEGRWERALDAARDVIGALDGEDRGQIVLAGRTVEVLGSPTADATALRQALGAAEPSVFRIDYGQLSRALDGLIRSAELPVVLDFVTDAQQTSLPTRFADLAPRRPAEIRVHDVAAGRADNWALDSFGGSALTGELEASVRSFAGETAERTLTLTLNGRAVDEQTIAIPAGGRAQARFAALDLAAGSNRVAVTLEPNDDLRADDERFLALQRPEPRAVLVIANEPRGRGVLYTSSAIGTLATLGLTPETAAPVALAERTLTDFSFIVVTDAGVLGDADARRLADYVEGGGGLLLALGQRSAGLSAVPVTGQMLASGATLGRAAAAAVGEVDATHPALRGVDELRSARFDRHVGIEPAADDRVLISLDNGAPLLVERTLGAGRVLLFTSSLDRDGNDLPVRPVFVPFIAGLANHLLGGEGFTSEAELGSTLAVRALGLAGGQIFDPRGEKALGLSAGSDDVLLDQIGFYEVVGGGRTELVAVNFDPRESDLAPIDAATVERWQGLGSRAGDEVTTTVPTAAGEAAPSPLGPWLLLALLLAALVESWVGNWHLKVRRGIAA
jgi:hypothetical protein